MRERIVLAYSGDLGSSVAIPWLSQHHRAEVVTVTLDLGQGRELEEVRERALAAGATRAHVLDVREEFARDYLVPTLQAGVLCPDGPPIGAALARPLLARTLVEVARIERVRSVAHGSDGSALETLVHDLDDTLRVVAPMREAGMTTADIVQYARRRRVPIPAAPEEHDHVNLWGRTRRTVDPPDVRSNPAESLRVLTRPLAATPDIPAFLEIRFEHGAPVSINGVPMLPAELAESLGFIAGQHGVGRMEWTALQPDAVTREISEAPAAQVLHVAHADVQASTLSADLAAIQRDLGVVYTDLVHGGRWFTPLREALSAFHAKAQSRVTGVSYITLFKGRARLMGPGGAAANPASAQAMASQS